MKSDKIRTNVYFAPELKREVEMFCKQERVSLTQFCESCVAHVMEILMAAKKKKKGKGKKC